MNVKAHKPYYNSNGDMVVGVTTVVGQEAKPVLIKWSNNLGLKGIDVTKYVDNTAEIGTLAHYMVECDLKGKEPDLSNYTPNQIKEARICVNKFHQWRKDNNFKHLHSEIGLVSEKFQYGGTCDIYCELNGKLTLIDLKTGRNIYPEHSVQVSAYRNLLLENGYPVDQTRILKIGREKTNSFEDHVVYDLNNNFKKFLILLELYKINKKLKGGAK